MQITGDYRTRDTSLAISSTLLSKCPSWYSVFRRILHVLLDPVGKLGKQQAKFTYSGSLDLRQVHLGIRKDYNIFRPSTEYYTSSFFTSSHPHVVAQPRQQINLFATTVNVNERFQ